VCTPLRPDATKKQKPRPAARERLGYVKHRYSKQNKASLWSPQDVSP